MRPKERRESGQNDLFRARLDQIVDMLHPLVRLARAIDWRFLEARFGAVYSDKAGHPPLPTRLMVDLPGVCGERFRFYAARPSN
jgi:IS5 family transposase